MVVFYVSTQPCCDTQRHQRATSVALITLLALNCFFCLKSSTFTRKSIKRFSSSAKLFNLFWIAIFNFNQFGHKVMSTDLIKVALPVSLVLGASVFVRKLRSDIDDLKTKRVKTSKSPSKAQEILETYRILFEGASQNFYSDRIMLEGLIEIMEHTKSGDPLSPLNFNNISNFPTLESKKGKKRRERQRAPSTRLILLREKKAFLKFVSIQYLEILKKFNYNPDLRISYLSFLFEQLQKTHVVLSEITFLEASFPLTLHHMYKLEALKLMIQDQNKEELEKSSKMVKLQVPRAIKRRLMKNLSELIEDANDEYIDLWDELLDENTHIRKVNDSIKKVFFLFRKIEIFWVENEANFEKMCSAMQLYGKFCKEVLHRVRLGDELIGKAKKMLKRGREQRGDLGSLAGIGASISTERPCLILSSNIEVSFYKKS